MLRRSPIQRKNSTTTRRHPVSWRKGDALGAGSESIGCEGRLGGLVVVPAGSIIGDRGGDCSAELDVGLELLATSFSSSLLREVAIVSLACAGMAVSKSFDSDPVL